MEIIENIISEISKKYDDMCKEAFEKCGYDYSYVLRQTNTFFRYRSDFTTGFRDTFWLGDPKRGNALALFEIEQTTDFEKNKIYIQCNILKKEAQCATS